MAEKQKTTTKKENERPEPSDSKKFMTPEEMGRQPRDMGAAKASPQRHLGREPKNR